MTNIEILQLQDDLANTYKYKPLPKDLSNHYRNLYKENLPAGLNINGADIPIYTLSGDIICYGYDRIVIGDYGAFIEYSQKQANTDDYIIQPGEEYRVRDPRYMNNVKYNWLTIGDSGLKIYQQKRTVSYADYKAGKYYISPHEDIVFGYIVNPEIPVKATITLGFDVIPNDCGECPLYINNVIVDDEPMWGSGIHQFCPFGSDYHGCMVERPKDCPIIETRKEIN